MAPFADPDKDGPGCILHTPFAIIVSMDGRARAVRAVRERRAAEGSIAMACRERLEGYLRENGVPFEVQHHPIAITAQEVAAAEHVPGKMLAKVVMVSADGEMAMLSLPAPYQVDLEKASKMLGAQEARLAQEEEFEGAFPTARSARCPPSATCTACPSTWRRPWPRTRRYSSGPGPTPTP